MINCKKHIIAAGFTLMLPLVSWAEAPVIDDSENFAILDGQRVADEAPVVNPKYQSNNDDGQPLVHEDQGSEPNNDMNSNAKLIDKIQSLQQEIQELRGQLEVQAHDLKLLQQQQIAFYKDLDSRLGTGAAKSAQKQMPTDLTGSAKAPAAPSVAAPAAKTANNGTIIQPTIAVSKANPADEQISYMAAYELVKEKRYDDAIKAMQAFTQKYPKGGYTANAEYWLGELYLVKKDYAQSIVHFETVLNEYPSSSKTAASLLKTGYAYAANGNREEAIKRFQQVVKTYPGTSTAQIANTKLEVIRAS